MTNNDQLDEMTALREQYKERLINKMKENYSVEKCENILFKALDYATKAHEGQKRNSGEDYIIHPMLVSEILIDLGLDESTVAAALLHDVIEDTETTYDDIVRLFNSEVADLVQGVTNLKKISYKSKVEEQAENFRKMFFAMAKDIRVLLIKLADRLHNMRSLKYLSRERQINMATETLDIYAKLAGRLGISQIKTELEDLCLKYLDPEKYYTLVELINTKLEERQRLVGLVMNEIEVMLKAGNIDGEVFGRPKHLYSIYKKMRDKNLSFEEIYDMIAVRVLVDSIDDCYNVLGKIHKRWKPVPMRFKDYLATPKANMYQSLHTTVVTNYGQAFEIQIRTHEMHRTAEYGIAAHWKYKEKRTAENELDERLAWIREVMEWEGDLKDSVDFMSSVKGDLYSAETLVFTPKGDVITLQRGSTTIDLAYKIHSGVGNKMCGAIVNGKMVPINYVLQTGDVVEIKTNPNSKGPSADWVKIAITNGAKSKIRQFFKKVYKSEHVKNGKVMLEKEAQRDNLPLSRLLTEEGLKVVFDKHSLQNEDEMYAAVGYGTITPKQVITKLKDIYLKDVKKKDPQNIINAVPKTNNNDLGIEIKGNTDLLVKLAKCCSPVPGDEIIGFISRGRGITIHRADCPNVKGMEKERLIEANWTETVSAKGFNVSLQIISSNATGVLANISSIISGMGIGITSFSAREDKNGRGTMDLMVLIKKSEDLETLKKKISALSEVYDVFRNNK